MPTPSSDTNQVCPLCLSASTNLFHIDRHRSYFRCHDCKLVFVPPHFFLSNEAEKKEYDLHQNSPDDAAYRSFLNRLFTPLEKRLAASSEGLDFGSGPGPTLSVMFEECGHRVRLYDKFYARRTSAFSRSYDFITATEVFEHLQAPHNELAGLWNCLKTSGWMGIMTKLVENREAFCSWHYKNDLTHVCFYSRQTFKWLALKWHADLYFIDKDVILLHKRS